MIYKCQNTIITNMVTKTAVVKQQLRNEIFGILSQNSQQNEWPGLDWYYKQETISANAQNEWKYIQIPNPFGSKLRG